MYATRCMPLSERPADPSPERPVSSLYCRTSRFASEADAGQAYFRAQDTLLRSPACDLSAYRLQLDQIWHVAVLGEQPPGYLDRQLRRILAAGDPTALPQEILQLLLERRASAAQRAYWVEGHYWPGERL
jgi:hypothetical protein